LSACKHECRVAAKVYRRGTEDAEDISDIRRIVFSREYR
jgi:hypothetical protein